MFKVNFHPILAATVFCGGTAAYSAEPAARPNIVLIFADDLGYGDVGCYGAMGYHGLRQGVSQLR